MPSDTGRSCVVDSDGWVCNGACEGAGGLDGVFLERGPERTDE